MSRVRRTESPVILVYSREKILHQSWSVAAGRQGTAINLYYRRRQS